MTDTEPEYIDVLKRLKTNGKNINILELTDEVNLYKEFLNETVQSRTRRKGK